MPFHIAFASCSPLPLIRVPPLFPQLSRQKSTFPHAVVMSSSLTRTHKLLPSRDISLQLLSTPVTTSPSSIPPLLFVPGSLHAAWCYEKFLVRIAETRPEIAACAVSLRGYTSKPAPPAGTVITADEHVDDLVALLGALPGPSPVLVGHSIGGYYVQRVAARIPQSLAGMVLLAPTPPSGNSRIVRRTIWRLGLRMSYRITMGFVKGTVATDISVARDMFFTRSGHSFHPVLESDERILEYMRLFARGGEVRVDTRTIVPLDPVKGWAAGHVLVIGGSDDTIVDQVALEESAEFWGASIPPVILDSCPHDLMLTASWEAALGHIIGWVETDLPRSLANNAVELDSSDIFLH